MSVEHHPDQGTGLDDPATVTGIPDETRDALFVELERLTQDRDRIQKTSGETISQLERKLRRLRRKRNWLAIPYVLLTFPISVPLLILFARRKKPKAQARPHDPRAPSRKWQTALGRDGHSNLPTDVRPSHQPVLIWCPIATAGLTTQLEQLTAILRKLGVAYQISYHIFPVISHPECRHWIPPRSINRPRVVFFMERYVQFERGFWESYHAYYMNLDWLSGAAISLGRVHADMVLAPTLYRLNEITQMFGNSLVRHVPWPSALAVAPPDAGPSDDEPIRILYVGNDYSHASRKSPFAVVEAILGCDRTDLVFDLKFRTPLPDLVRRRLVAHRNVDHVIDAAVPKDAVAALYATADINLIPNESEGNGLSIIEAFGQGVVPAVLDGHPMRDVVTEDLGYLLPCSETGHKDLAPLYKTDAQSLSTWLDGLDHDGVRQRKRAIGAFQSQLKARESDLEATVRTILSDTGLLRGGSGNGSEGSAADRLFAPRTASAFRIAEQIDIYLTTAGRPDHLAQSLDALTRAIAASELKHRLTVMVDNADRDTEAVLDRYRDDIFLISQSQEKLGLPFLWNSILDLSKNVISRTEEHPDFICYLQDDCLIQNPETYFADMVSVAQAADPGRLGFVSGYHSDVHKGFARTTAAGFDLVLSHSIDGKNFMARPKLLHAIGPLSWWNLDGNRRGNPGPDRGSHFDLWQWAESPSSLAAQGRVNVIVPGLCAHTAPEKSQSTWNNDTTEAAIAARVASGRVYGDKA